MLAPRNRIRSERGFTLVEVTIILLVLVILSMIMLPQLGNFNRLARKVKVYEDVGAICANFKKFLDEVMSNPFIEPGGGVIAPQLPVGLLVGPGTPPDATPIMGTTPRTTGAFPEVWDSTAPTDPAFTVQTDSLASSIPFAADLLVHHLQFNNPFGTSVVFTDRYKNVIELPSVGAFLGWRGPYFNEITSDPWGGRYSINTFGLHGGTTGASDDIYSTAVVCISFGPNRQAETLANQPINISPFGFALGGDDIAAVLSGVGPF
jgi:type II secretory pathway pseudopilin PulG